MMRQTARVIVDDEVWSVRADSAARWAVVATGLLRPLPADTVDTTAKRPVWRNGKPVRGFIRWATPADLVKVGMLAVGGQRAGGR